MKRMYQTAPTVLATNTASATEVHAGFLINRKDSPSGSLGTITNALPCYLLAILSVVILFIFCSCQREQPLGDNPLAVAKKPIQIHCTSAESPHDSLLLFAYGNDKEKYLDSYSKLPLHAQTEVILTNGPKTLVALCGFNEKDFYYNEISTWESMSGLCVCLEEEDPARPRMSGCIQIEDGNNKKLPLELSPLLSKIHLRTLKADFSGQSYEGLKIDSIRCYLTYVNTRCPVVEKEKVSAEVLCNYGQLNKEDLKQFRHPEMLYQEIPGSIGKEGREVNIYLYCYPNQNPEESFSTPFTRLVIECCIGGEKFYYPINLGKEMEIKRNKNYVVDICLKHLGSRDPDQVIERSEAQLIFSILDWEKQEEKTEKF